MILIVEPCVIESEQLVFEIASKMKEIASKVGVEYIFKASFDKAIRFSAGSYRGPGVDKGLQILSNVKRRFWFKNIDR
jgi:2-dehydro-3-deoxyphosphooctonate aldolase (KDO 8-P synthase)